MIGAGLFKRIACTVACFEFSKEFDQDILATFAKEGFDNWKFSYWKHMFKCVVILNKVFWTTFLFTYTEKFGIWIKGYFTVSIKSYIVLYIVSFL